jgi:WhiB family redox-sensing transcriptional regulator
VSNFDEKSKLRYPAEYEDPTCREIGTEPFFAPDKDEEIIGPAYLDSYDLKKICKVCPHLEECAEWGIRNEIWGVWGGLTSNERNKIRKVRNLPSPGLGLFVK